jgi:hypothetical protein
LALNDNINTKLKFFSLKLLICGYVCKKKKNEENFFLPSQTQTKLLSSNDNERRREEKELSCLENKARTQKKRA